MIIRRTFVALTLGLASLTATAGFASAAAGTKASPAAKAHVAPAGKPTQTLRVFAAASLTEAFGELAKEYERTHPGLTVQLSFAGSQQLAAQIEQGAPADVFASADPNEMQKLKDGSRLADRPTVFARNRLLVIVPSENPAHITRLVDLAKPGVKLVLAAETVPIGKYSREALQNMSRITGFTDDFGPKALANVVSEEENVKAVVGKVQLGEADAGLVYRSDVTAAVAHRVHTLSIPDAANVLALYPIAVLRAAPHGDDARAFIALVLSEAGQQILVRHGFMAATLAP